MAELLGGRTIGAFVLRGPAYQKAYLFGSYNGEIVLGERVDIAGAAIAGDDPGTSEHGGCQESKNGDLHGAGRRKSRSAMAVITRTAQYGTWLENAIDGADYTLN